MDPDHTIKQLMPDPNLIPRVKQYLEENIHQTYVDVNVMTRYLQEKYREYARRKQQPFRFVVDQAYRTVLRSYGLDSEPSTDGENSDVELMEDTPAQGNRLNDMMNTVYRAGTSGTSNNEGNSKPQNDCPIDISSDESEDEPTKKDNNDDALLGLQLPKDIVIAPTQWKPNSIKRVKDSHDAMTNSGNEHTNDNSELPASVSSKRRRVEVGDEVSAVLTEISDAIKAITSSVTSAEQRKRHTQFDRMESSASKTSTRKFKHSPDSVSFADIGGIGKITKQLEDLISIWKSPEAIKKIGLLPSRGILLHGPTGTGKTLLARAIAGELQHELIEVPATELISGISGGSEDRIREVFEKAAANAPCVLFIDEIDSIASNRANASKDRERRIVSQLILSLDDLSTVEGGDRVIVIGTASNADEIDPNLRRSGRFDKEICLGIPDRGGRVEVLKISSKQLRLEPSFDYDAVATLTPGYVGSDINALCTLAGMVAILNVIQQKKSNAATKGAAVEQPSTSAENIDDSQNQAEAKHDEVVEVQPVDNVEPMETNEDKEKEPEKDKEESVQVSGQIDGAEKKDAGNVADAVATDVEVPAKSLENEKATESIPVNTSDSSVEVAPNVETPTNVSFNDRFVALTEEDVNEVFVTMNDFKEAIKLITPSAKREGFITAPDVTWDDIGSLSDIHEELFMAISAPIKYPERFAKLGIEMLSGILLCGPPGCGKTLVAKAIANEAGINFISVKGPEMLNMYVGESERNVRKCFERAISSAPCVIFFDEFDALCPKRTGASDSPSSRIVNQLLTVMDGVELRKNVFVMAATNRPDMIDPAVLRPGRLDQILYIGLPDKQDRLEILKAQTKNGTKPPLSDDISLEEISEITESFTGADLAELIKKASRVALKESFSWESDDRQIAVGKSHFTSALANFRPSISEADKVKYQQFREMYGKPQQPGRNENQNVSTLFN